MSNLNTLLVIVVFVVPVMSWSMTRAPASPPSGETLMKITAIDNEEGNDDLFSASQEHRGLADSQHSAQVSHDTDGKGRVAEYLLSREQLFLSKMAENGSPLDTHPLYSHELHTSSDFSFPDEEGKAAEYLLHKGLSFISKRAVRPNSMCIYELHNSSGMIDSKNAGGRRCVVLAPKGFLINIIFNDTTWVPASINQCFRKPEPFIRLSESEPSVRPIRTIHTFCPAIQTPSRPSSITFMTVANQTSITFNRQFPENNWTLWYTNIKNFYDVRPADDQEQSSDVEFSGSDDSDETGFGDDSCLVLDRNFIRSGIGVPVDNSSCSMSLKLDRNETVELTFLEIGLSVPSDMDNCAEAHSFIRIRAWEDRETIKETFLCSNQSEGSRFSSTHRIDLFYQRSPQVQHGFVAQLRVSRQDMLDIDSWLLDLREIIDMWQYLTMTYYMIGHSGTFTSIGYPDKYSPYQTTWDITVIEGNRILLQFVDIDLGYSSPVSCSDRTPKLTILTPTAPDDSNQDFSLYQVYCGALPYSNTTSRTNKMMFTFNPRDKKGGRGIRVNYTSIDGDDDPFRRRIGDVHTSTSETPTSATPSSATPSSATPSSAMPSSETPPSETPSSETLSSEMPASATPSSATLSSETPLSETPSSATPPSATPSSATPTSATPLSATPSSATPPSATPSSATSPSATPLSAMPSSAMPSSAMPSSECTVLFADDQLGGTFATANFPRYYPANYTSCWLVMAEGNTSINLTFRDFELDSSYLDICDTRYSYVTITDFVSEDIVLCGRREEGLSYTFPNGMFKVSMVGRLGQGRGFLAMFTLESETNTQCNANSEVESRIANGSVSLPALMSRCLIGDVWSQWYVDSSKDRDWLASPFFPNPFPAGSHCLWVIRGGEVVVDLTFKYFDLGEGSPPSCSDADAFLLIRSCVTREEMMMCGSHNAVEELAIPSNAVEIEFNSSSTGKGFQAFYTLKPAGTEKPVLRTIPPTAAASTPPIEPSTQQSSSVTPTVLAPLVTEEDMCQGTRTDECGASFVNLFGSFSSPFYPNDYPINTTCRWIVSSPSSKQGIVLKFLDVDLGAPSNCDLRYGYLSVNSSGDLSILCDTNGQNFFITQGDSIYIEFSSQFSSGRGFCAAYVAFDVPYNGSLAELKFPCVCPNLYTNVSWRAFQPAEEILKPSNCQYLIHGNSGILPADDFPRPYPPSSECVWTMLSEPGEYVSLGFHFLDLDATRTRNRRTCLLSDTHVQVTLFAGDGFFQKRYCAGDDASAPIPAAQSATIKFISGSIRTQTHNGFKMWYNFSQGIPQGFPENDTWGNSSYSDTAFRVFLGGDDESSVFESSVVDQSSVDVDTQTRKTDAERPRLTFPLSDSSDIPSDDEVITVFDQAIVITDPYITEIEEFVTMLDYTDASTPNVGRTTTFPDGQVDSASMTTTRESKATTSLRGVLVTKSKIPERGRMTDRQVELTIFICTGVAAFLVILLIVLTLYCAKNRRTNSKSGFDVDATEEANYWQTYKDWAKDWATEPVGSAPSTVGAMCGEESAAAAPAKRRASSDGLGDGGAVAGEGENVKTVSAVVNPPPQDKPSRNFVPSEQLV